jgi:hypothetical protein
MESLSSDDKITINVGGFEYKTTEGTLVTVPDSYCNSHHHYTYAHTHIHTYTHIHVHTNARIHTWASHTLVKQLHTRTVRYMHTTH